MDIINSPFTYLIIQTAAIFYLWLRRPKQIENLRYHPSQTTFSQLELRVAQQARTQNNFRTDVAAFKDDLDTLAKSLHDIWQNLEGEDDTIQTTVSKRIEKLETDVETLDKNQNGLLETIGEQTELINLTVDSVRDLRETLEPLTNIKIKTYVREEKLGDPNEDSSGE